MGKISDYTDAELLNMTSGFELTDAYLNKLHREPSPIRSLLDSPKPTTQPINKIHPSSVIDFNTHKQTIAKRDLMSNEVYQDLTSRLEKLRGGN